jgi:hypothetical protein
MPTNRTLPLLALAAAVPLAAWAQVPGQAPDAPANAPASAQPPETEASKALAEAIEKVKAITTVAAEIAMDAQMLGQRFRVVGEYLRAPEHRVKLRLSVEGLGDVTGLSQQVSDGTTLYDVTQILDTPPSIRKITLAPILQILDKPDTDAEVRDVYYAQIGFGGPEALLEGVRRSVAFDQKRPATLDGHEVWVLGGRWTDTSARGLPGAQAGPNPGMPTILPPYVPSYVEVWLDQADGWPYKVVFEGSSPSASLREDRMLGPDGKPIGRKPSGGKEKPTNLVLVYNRQDREVKAGDFLFQPPPDVEPIDGTDEILARLEAQIAAAAAARRGEAAGASGDLLDQPLTAPRPDGSAPASPGEAPSPETFRSSAPPR